MKYYSDASRTPQSAELAPSLPLPACALQSTCAGGLGCSLAALQVSGVLKLVPPATQPFSFALFKFCLFFRAHKAQVPSDTSLSYVQRPQAFYP